MKWWAFLLFLAFVLAMSFLTVLYKPSEEFIEGIFLSAAELGWIGCLLLLGLQAGAVLCALPVVIGNLALSKLYSFPIAFLISIAGYTLGSAAVYAVMRLCKWEPSARLRRLHEVLKRQPFKYALLLRFVCMPTSVKNYGLASCPVSFLVFIATGLIHGLYVNGLQLLTMAQLWSADSLLAYVMLAITALLSVVSVILLSYFAHRAIRREENGELVPEVRSDIVSA